MASASASPEMGLGPVGLRPFLPEFLPTMVFVTTFENQLSFPFLSLVSLLFVLLLLAFLSFSVLYIAALLVCRPVAF